MEYVAIGGDAHSDVQRVKKSVASISKLREDGHEVHCIFRGGDDGADPRFLNYEGLGLKQIAKIARDKGLKGPERYAEVLRLFEQGLREGRPEFVQFEESVERYAYSIMALFSTHGLPPVRMIAGNADCFQDYIRAAENKRKAEAIFNHGNSSYSTEVSLDVLVKEDGKITVKPYEEGMETEEYVAFLKIPYSFSPEVENALGGVVNHYPESASREVIEKSLERTLEQLNKLSASRSMVVVQIQHEPPVQSLATMLDPRNRPIEQAEVYQRAIDAVTDMKPAEHLIFYGHVGNHNFARAVPHELVGKTIFGTKTFHWPEEGKGGMLYLCLNSHEVRDEIEMLEGR